MDKLSVLVMGQDGDDSRPVTLEVFSIAQNLTLLGVQIRVRLQPSAHRPFTKLSTAVISTKLLSDCQQTVAGTGILPQPSNC